MKKLIVLVSIFFVFIGVLSFVSTDRDIENKAVVFKKRIGIMPTTQTFPDTNCLLQVGDVANATVGAIRLYSTDTTSVVTHKVRGLIILNSLDTNIWVYTGKRWKKAGS